VQYHVPSDVDVVVTLLKASPSNHNQSAREVSFTNEMAPFSEGQIEAEVGAQRLLSGTADFAKGPMVYPVRVDSGATSLRVRVAPADTAADLDLYLYDCTDGTCYLWDLNRQLSATKCLFVRAPRAGQWKVVIDPAHASTGYTPFVYSEIVTAARYGTASVSRTMASASNSPGGWSAFVSARVHSESQRDREPVIVADLIDAGAEREERAHPMARFLMTPYRPVVIASLVMPASLK